VDDLKDLDPMFQLSTAITNDPDLRALYEVLRLRLLKDLEPYPMQTVHYMWAERILANFIALKAKERRAIGEVGGFAHGTSQKDFNTFWLATTTSFMKSVETMRSNDRGQIFDEVMKAVRLVADELPPEYRDPLLARLADKLEEAGL
jgi:flagellar biosynthesis/type III secretory pathway protein FliH